MTLVCDVMLSAINFANEMLKWQISKMELRVGGMEVCSLLQLSERWPCHIWPVFRVKVTSLQAIFDGARDL